MSNSDIALLGGLALCFVLSSMYFILTLSKAYSNQRKPLIQTTGRIVDKQMRQAMGLITVATYVIQCDNSRERLTLQGEGTQLSKYVVGDHIAFEYQGENLKSCRMLNY